MKKINLLFIILFTFNLLHAQNVPDPVLAALIAADCPSCISGQTLLPTAQTIKKLTLQNSSPDIIYTSIGLEYFTELDTLIIKLNDLRQLRNVPPNIRYLHLEIHGQGNLWGGDILLNDGLTYMFLSGIYSEGFGLFPRTLQVLELDKINDEGYYFFLCLPSGLDTLRNVSNDPIYVPNFPRNTVIEGQFKLSSFYPFCLDSNIYVKLNLYVDKNCNGIFDTGDFHPDQTKILVQPGAIELDGYNYAFFAEANTIYLISIIPPNDKKYTFSSGSSMTITTGTKVDTSIYLNVPMCPIPPSESTVMGRLYLDQNQNRLKDTNEDYLSGLTMHATPVNKLLLTDNTGKFSFTADTGTTVSMDLNPPTANYFYLADGSLQITMPGKIDSMHWLGDFPVWDSRKQFDGNLDLIVSGGNRKYAQLLHSVVIKNSGSDTLKGRLTLNIDNWKFNNFYDFLPIPDRIDQNGDDFIFTYLNVIIPPLQSKEFSLHGSILQDKDQIIKETAIFSAAGGLLLSDQIEFIIGAPYDPNYIEVNKERISENYIREKQYLTYTIHFQNIGTLSATDVRIIDYIPAGLSPYKIELIGSSAPVQLISILDPETLLWELKDIHLAAAMDDSVASCGYISYRIGIDSRILPKTQIRHAVDILFDREFAVKTNQALTKYYCPQMDGLHLATVDHQNFKCSDGLANVEIFPNLDFAPINILWNDSLHATKRSFAEAGDYGVLVADNALCRESYNFRFTMPEPLTYQATFLSDTLLHLIPIGGTRPYEIQWPELGVTGEYIVVPTGGNYHFIITDFNGCKMEDSLQIKILSIDKKSNSSLLIYPSPVNNTLSVFTSVQNKFSQ